MARAHCIDLPRHFSELLSAKRLWGLARETKFVQRVGKINPFKLVFTLVLGFGAGSARNVSALRREYERASGVHLVPSAFYDRFGPQLVEFLRRVIAHLIEATIAPVTRLGGALAGFRDLMIADASVLRLRDLLEKHFPACRTNHTKAAAKLHMVLSATGLSSHTVAVTGERVNDRHRLRIGPWVRDRLLLFDLGYYGFRLFDRIRRNGGYFISRFKSSGNPVIVKQHRRWRGRSVSVVGRKLKDVLSRLQRQVLDVEVEVGFVRRSYGGHQRRAKTTFRLVGVRNEETGEYHLYITNVPPERLTAEEVALAYRARWEIELLFKAWKTEFRLDELPSRKKEVVEALIYAAIITMLLTRSLLALLRAAAGDAAERVTAGRVVIMMRHLASFLLTLITAPSADPGTARALRALIAHEMVDPHRNRPNLLLQASGIGPATA